MTNKKATILSKKFYFDNSKSEFLMITWERGVRNLKLYLNSELIHKFSNAGNLLKGEVVFHDKVGNINVKLFKGPTDFEVQVGDRYLINSKIEAKERVGLVSAMFIILGALSLAINMFMLKELLDPVGYDVTQLGWLLYFTDLVLNLYNFVVAYLVRKGKTWAYLSGIAIFALVTLLYLDLIAIVVFRIFMLIVMLRHWKNMRKLTKHNKAVKGMEKATDSDVLDYEFK